jgi:hypothetical protein
VICWHHSIERVLSFEETIFGNTFSEEHHWIFSVESSVDCPILYRSMSSSQCCNWSVLRLGRIGKTPDVSELWTERFLSFGYAVSNKRFRGSDVENMWRSSTTSTFFGRVPRVKTVLFEWLSGTSFKKQARFSLLLLIWKPFLGRNYILRFRSSISFFPERMNCVSPILRIRFFSRIVIETVWLAQWDICVVNKAMVIYIPVFSYKLMMTYRRKRTVSIRIFLSYIRVWIYIWLGYQKGNLFIVKITINLMIKPVLFRKQFHYRKRTTIFLFYRLWESIRNWNEGVFFWVLVNKPRSAILLR